ncbi:MAG: heparinase II/III family protein [Puniceicoccales bacterium]|nr:heparinase II/III family protein [Puniceicoccales bacterium]
MDVLNNWRTLELGHPRLLWTKDDQAQAIKRYKTDEVWKMLQASIVREADLQIKTPVAQHKLVGIRLLGESRDALRRIMLESYVWRMTGEARYRERALAEMRAVCAFPDWNPKHFLDTAEMAFAVAIGYDWLYESLSEEDKGLFREALVKHALIPGMKVYESKAGWHTRNNNWNQVCNGGLLAAALAIAEDESTLARKVIKHAVESLPRAMSQYGPDGGYQEGPAYWEYGTTYNVVAIATLKKAIDTDFELSGDRAFQRTAFCFRQLRGNSGLYFNYADGGTRVEVSPAYSWLGNEYGPEIVRQDARAMLTEFLKKRENNAVTDGGRFFPLYGVWFPGKASDRVDGRTAPLSAHFRGNADIAVMRSHWTDPNSAYVGLKAGKNDVPHSHLDLGSFVYDILGVRWVEDLGGDYYDLPGYWDSQQGGGRWKIFRLNNLGHGTLIPEGLLQNAKGEAKIVKLVSSNEGAFTIADLGGAYPDQLTSWSRGLSLDYESGKLVVQDDVESKEAGTRFEWKIFTRAKVTVSPENPCVATLVYQGRKMHVFSMAPEGFVFENAEADPGLERQSVNKGFRQLILKGVFLEKKGTIQVLFVPDSGKGGLEMFSMPGMPLDTWGQGNVGAENDDMCI